MSEDGVEFVPHIDACFLIVEPGQRIVWTNALDSTCRPAVPMPVALTAEITFADHPEGCAYSAVARHGDAATRTHHEELGFIEGWGALADQLARLVCG